MGQILFLTGPVRSGKSRAAVARAQAWGPGVVFVATYALDPGDGEMVDRVRRHREERPDSWRVLEAPQDVEATLAGLDPEPSGVVLDCQTLWLSARMGLPDTDLLDRWNKLLGFLKEAPYPSVIVGNEVGWSPVPDDPELRRWRDLAGWQGQLSAAAASEALLLVAGCPVRLK